jgi:hypothetical protein
MAKHLVVAGGSFKGGAIGVAPTDVATDRKGAINAAITGVEFFGQSYASIIATTGVVVTGGRATWLGPRAVCIMLGDDRAVGGGASHASITGFTCHCSRCSTLIKAYVDGRRCSKGAEKEFQTCTSDADCGGTSGSCTYDGVDGVSITGNTLLGGRPRHISTAIDLGSEFDADSGSVSDVVLSGNVIQLLGGTRRCFSFPGATFVEKASNIEIGINADASCTTRAYQWQDSMGRDWEAPKMAIRE